MIQSLVAANYDSYTSNLVGLQNRTLKHFIRLQIRIRPRNGSLNSRNCETITIALSLQVVEIEPISISSRHNHIYLLESSIVAWKHYLI